MRTRTEVVAILPELVSGLSVEDVMLVLTAIDSVSIRRAAHALKGMASGLAGDPVVNCTGKFETMARSELPDEAGQLLPALKREVSRLVFDRRNHLNGLVDGNSIDCAR